jgi:hypothetical protein
VATDAREVPVKRLVLAVCGWSVLAGCGREFEPYWKVLDFRVLAVRSSHPELRPGQTAQLDALTYTNFEQPVEYAWEWCPFRTSASSNFECPVTADQLAQILAGQGQGQGDGQAQMPPGTLPEFDFSLGNTATVEFPYPAPQQFIEQYCLAIQKFASNASAEVAGAVPVVDCERGLDVTVRLVAKSGDKQIVAGKRINLWTGADGVNQNPKVVDVQIRPANRTAAEYLRDQGIEWVSDPSQDEGLWWKSIPENGSLDIHAGVPFEVRSLVDPVTVDLWQPPAPQGSDLEFLPEESEVLVYRWMTTFGSYDPSERIYKDGLNTIDNASITPFSISGQGEDFDDDGLLDSEDPCVATPATGDKAEDDCTMTLWSIVRDGRLGTDWLERKLNVTGVRR